MGSLCGDDLFGLRYCASQYLVFVRAETDSIVTTEVDRGTTTFVKLNTTYPIEVQNLLTALVTLYRPTVNFTNIRLPPLPSNKFSEIPNVTADSRLHRWRHPQATVNPAEIVVREVQRQRRP